MKAVFDVETTIYNKGHVHDPRNFLVSFAFHFEDGRQVYAYYKQPDFLTILKNELDKTTELVAHNAKFDLAWLRRVGCSYTGAIWDTSLAEFILSGQLDGFISLTDCLERYGLPAKLDRVKEYWEAGTSTEDIPEEVLEEYNRWDVYTTWLLYQTQQQLVDEKQRNLIYIEGEDLLSLQDAEQNGVLFDKEKAQAHASNIVSEVTQLEQQILSTLDLPSFVSFNFDSGDHLSAFLYGGNISFDYSIAEEAIYKSGTHKGQSYTRNRWHTYTHTFPRRFSPLEKTEVKKTKDLPKEETHFYQVDEPTLKQLKSSDKESKTLLKVLMERSKKIKVAEMLLSLCKNIDELHWENNFIHGSFNQNAVRTGRLSSSKPNLQNQPPEIDEFFISRFGS